MDNWEEGDPPPGGTPNPNSVAASVAATNTNPCPVTASAAGTTTTTTSVSTTGAGSTTATSATNVGVGNDTGTQGKIPPKVPPKKKGNILPLPQVDPHHLPEGSSPFVPSCSLHRSPVRSTARGGDQSSVTITAKRSKIDSVTHMYRMNLSVGSQVN